MKGCLCKLDVAFLGDGNQAMELLLVVKDTCVVYDVMIRPTNASLHAISLFPFSNLHDNYLPQLKAFCG